MAQDPTRLIWIDMEMSGLNPDTDRILEVAIVVTDTDLNIVAEAPVLVVHQPDTVLDAMDAWNKNAHGTSGLVQRVKASSLCEHDVQQQMLKFVADYVPPSVSPMCGNSVHQDRRFLGRHMPELEAYFLYRNLDVSTLKELARRWRKDLSGLAKHGKHEALADIRESIEELKYYRQHFLRVP